MRLLLLALGLAIGGCPSSGGGHTPTWEEVFAGSSWSGTYTDIQPSGGGTRVLDVFDIAPGTGWVGAAGAMFYIEDVSTCVNPTLGAHQVGGKTNRDFVLHAWNDIPLADITFVGTRTGDMISGTWGAGSWACGSYYPYQGTFELTRL